MTCREIYEAALRLLGESTVYGENDDYEERAPYIIAAFCTDVRETDEAWREASGKEDGETAACSSVCIGLDEEFPLSDRFAPSAAYYLAAILVLESNETLSDRLYDKCSDAVSRIRDGIPSEAMPIINKYF